MGEPVRIEAETADEGRELIDALARHGLIGRLVAAGGRWRVEIDSPREETQRLLLDLRPALAMWLADRHQASILLGVGARSLLVRRERPIGGELSEGGPYVVGPSRKTREEGGIHGSDREMEPVA